MTKHPRYQDYVIKDGKLVGEFEEMYQDFPDPWDQTTRERNRTEKELGTLLLHRAGAKRVIELGCGLGHYTSELALSGLDAMGVDVSPTAIKKARTLFPGLQFEDADILDFDLYRTFKPDAIVMAEITWYILPKLDAFLHFMRSEMPNTLLLHLLVTYPTGTQKYGADRFSSLKEILAYFNMHYIEAGEIIPHGWDGERRTYFLGKPVSKLLPGSDEKQ